MAYLGQRKSRKHFLQLRFGSGDPCCTGLCRRGPEACWEQVPKQVAEVLTLQSTIKKERKQCSWGGDRAGLPGIRKLLTEYSEMES